MDPDVLFQSTPLREGRRLLSKAMLLLIGFNPRPCVRGDVICHYRKLGDRMFQSTPLREGRLDMFLIPMWDKMFQSTPLREGRLSYLCSLFHAKVFQSTPLREGRLVKRLVEPF